jgi:hypothetical protein
MSSAAKLHKTRRPNALNQRSRRADSHLSKNPLPREAPSPVALDHHGAVALELASLVRLAARARRGPPESLPALHHSRLTLPKAVPERRSLRPQVEELGHPNEWDATGPTIWTSTRVDKVPREFPPPQTLWTSRSRLSVMAAELPPHLPAVRVGALGSSHPPTAPLVQRLEGESAEQAAERLFSQLQGERLASQRLEEDLAASRARMETIASETEAEEERITNRVSPLPTRRGLGVHTSDG